MYEPCECGHDRAMHNNHVGGGGACMKSIGRPVGLSGECHCEKFRGTDYKTAQQKRREVRLPIRTSILMSLQGEGFKIEQKTPYHFRVNGRLDLWPIHNRFHDIKTGRRGGFARIDYFVRAFFKNQK